ncbi:hypothetical protein BU17DRAFT_37395 [Hysterangium stoloniferum]|nr:hypothetical protein BU17DRAFT_37395 [Hysterangium stoloniferum]
MAPFFPPYNNYPISPYGQQQQQQWTVPLSTYSSLNGATSSQVNTQSQRSPVQQVQSPVVQHSPPPQQQQAQSQPSHQVQAQPAHHHQQHQHQQQPQQQPQQQQPQQPPQQHLYQQQPQQQVPASQPQTITIDQATHSPTTGYAPAAFFSYSTPALTLNPSLLHNISHAPVNQSLSQQINSPVAGPSVPTKATLTNVLNGLLSAKGLPSSPMQIVRTIVSMGPSEVDLSVRLQVLSKIRDYAGNDFYQAWSSNSEAMEIIRDWLKGAVTSKTGDWDETVMPLLHVIDRLPLTIDSLKSSKIGKVILKLKDTSSSSAVKDMASNLENRWRSLLDKTHVENGVKKEGKSIEDDPSTSKAVPPTKKIAVAKSTASVPKAIPVKKETKPVTAVKDAKSDSSFFSAPKPKPKLPSFKKAPPLKKENVADPNVAQPSAVDPFKDALAAMTKARSSPVPIDATAVATAAPPPQSVSTGIPGKKKKRVSFKEGEALEMVRIIEPAVYDDDVTNGFFQGHNIRDLDRDEGAAMHKHIFEEQIDWLEPSFLELPPALATPRGENSQEKAAQEEREKSALNAFYMSSSQIPDSPAEPTNQIPEDEVDINVKHMVSGNDVRELDRSGDSSAPISVQELISQLTGAGASAIADPIDTTMATDPAPTVDLKQLGLDLNLIAQLAAQQPQALAQNSVPAVNGYTYAPPQQPYVNDAWNGQYQEYSQQQITYEEDGAHRTKGWDSSTDQGWRGRGRGGGSGTGRGGRGAFRHTKRKLCNFYAHGRRAREFISPQICRYGDQCDFLHELP